MINVTHSGGFKKTESFFKRMDRAVKPRFLERYGQRGVDALAGATPIDSAETSRSWDYNIVTERTGIITIEWTNSNIIDGNPIAILIQYGHATGTGGYVVGRDYINPAIRPIFDDILNDIWKQVTR